MPRPTRIPVALKNSGPPLESTPHSNREKRGFSRKHLAALIAAVLIVVLAYLAQPYIKLLGPPEKCWETREIDGRLYKANPCTGQFKLIGDVQK